MESVVQAGPEVAKLLYVVSFIKYSVSQSVPRIKMLHLSLKINK